MLGREILAVRDCSVGYTDYPLLKNIEFCLCEGEIVALLGKNASGKSTLIRALYGQTAWFSGQLVYKGSNYDRLPAVEINEGRIGWMLQERPVFPGVSVWDALAGIGSKYSLAEFRLKIGQLSAHFPGLSEIIKSTTDVLSGGERALVSLAMTLVNEPRLIFLDEPFAGMDKKRIPCVLRGLRSYLDEHSAACLIIEHRSEVISELECVRINLDDPIYRGAI